MEFRTKALGLAAEEVHSTRAYKDYLLETPDEAAMLFQSRVLAYAPATWKTHTSSLQEFLQFCRFRSVNVFTCTPSLVNVFQLKLAQDSKMYKTIERILNSISFLYKFFLMPNYTDHKTVTDVKQFLQKACNHSNRRKSALESAAVRKIWDSIECKGGIEKLSKVELRTFVMTVVQHSALCRFSDLQNIKLSDVLFNADYFKLTIRYSKTDQAGLGSYAFIPKTNSGFRDPHMLLCLYLQNMDMPNDHDTYLFPPLV